MLSAPLQDAFIAELEKIAFLKTLRRAKPKTPPKRVRRFRVKANSGHQPGVVRNGYLEAPPSHAETNRIARQFLKDLEKRSFAKVVTKNTTRVARSGWEKAVRPNPSGMINQTRAWTIRPRGAPAASQRATSKPTKLKGWVRRSTKEEVRAGPRPALARGAVS